MSVTLSNKRVKDLYICEEACVLSTLGATRQELKDNVKEFEKNWDEFVNPEENYMEEQIENLIKDNFNCISDT